MKVLLTGANGFVGSHILDRLRAAGIDTCILLRPAANTRFIERHLPQVEVRPGSITDPSSLKSAVSGATHVIHCAGSVKALGPAAFHAANCEGVRHLLQAMGEGAAGIERFVHISSLAAGGPAGPDAPAREDHPSHPVSDYGRSKLAGEEEIGRNCRTSQVVLRPPAVYGPRDVEFLRLFKAVKRHVRPLFSGGRQALSLVYVGDLADAAVAALTFPASAASTYYVASPEVVTARAFVDEIASQMGGWTVPLPLPAAALWPVCALQEMFSRVTGKPSVLSLQKYAELTAAGWVWDPSKLRERTGFVCKTGLKAGVAEALEWYRKEGWL